MKRKIFVCSDLAIQQPCKPMMAIHYLILSDSIYEYDSRNNSFTIIHLEKNISEQSHVIRQVISDTNCRFLFTANTLYSRTENKEWKKNDFIPFGGDYWDCCTRLW